MADGVDATVSVHGPRGRATAARASPLLVTSAPPGTGRTVSPPTGADGVPGGVVASVAAPVGVAASASQLTEASSATGW